MVSTSRTELALVVVCDTAYKLQYDLHEEQLINATTCITAYDTNDKDCDFNDNYAKTDSQ